MGYAAYAYARNSADTPDGAACETFCKPGALGSHVPTFLTSFARQSTIFLRSTLFYLNLIFLFSCYLGGRRS